MVSTVHTCVRKLLQAYQIQRHVCLYVQPSVLLSLHMEQLGPKCTDFREIIYFVLLKSVDEISECEVERTGTE